MFVFSVEILHLNKMWIFKKVYNFLDQIRNLKDKLQCTNVSNQYFKFFKILFINLIDRNSW